MYDSPLIWGGEKNCKPGTELIEEGKRLWGWGVVVCRQQLPRFCLGGRYE